MYQFWQIYVTTSRNLETFLTSVTTSINPCLNFDNSMEHLIFTWIYQKSYMDFSKRNSSNKFDKYNNLNQLTSNQQDHWLTYWQGKTMIRLESDKKVIGKLWDHIKECPVKEIFSFCFFCAESGGLYIVQLTLIWCAWDSLGLSPKRRTKGQLSCSLRSAPQRHVKQVCDIFSMFSWW